MESDLHSAVQVAKSIVSDPAYLALHQPPDPHTGKASDATKSRSVFISWAHSNAGWTTSRAKAWQTQVADFAATLVELGIDAEIDLFHLDEAVDWTRFGPSGVQSADMTLVVMSKAWAERWSGENDPTVGAGATAEADTLRGMFAKNQLEWQRKVVIVMFPEVDDAVLPPDLERVTRLYVNLDDPDSIESVIRLVTGQPRFPKPRLGKIPALGPDVAYGDVSATVRNLRLRLMETRRRASELKSARTDAALAERRELAMRESALLGFIDAMLKGED